MSRYNNRLYNSGNTASYGGGFYYCSGTITNYAIFRNSAANNGGGLLNCNGPITNCILWGNSAGEDGDQIFKSVVPAYSCIQNWNGGGIGNITLDPMFLDPVNNDLRLRPGSPCIDTGTNNPPGGLASTDIEGFARSFDGNLDGIAVVDMGAYEAHEIADEAVLYAAPVTLSFSVHEPDDNLAEKMLTVQNRGLQTLNWSVDLTDKPAWLSVTPTAGPLESGQREELTVSVDTTGLVLGRHSYAFEIINPAALNSPQMINISTDKGNHCLCSPGFSDHPGGD